MGIFPRMGQRSKILLPIRTNLAEYNEIPELTTISTTTSIPSVQDGPTVVARYRNLVIGAGATLTTQYRCCGLVLVVHGDLTVNGAISMTARGASFQPTGDHRIKNDLLPGNDVLYEIDIPATADEIAAFLLKEKKRYHALDELPVIYRPTLYCRGPHGTVYVPADLGAVPAVGAAGGAGVYHQVSGNAGSNGSNGQCGGGGGGGAGYAATASAGAAGTCYSGGSGGSGCYSSTVVSAGAAFGGAGGGYVSGSSDASGGAGNPAGAGHGGGAAGIAGTGGLLIIICTGDVNIGASGHLSSLGSSGGNNATGSGGGGGGSGGGSINVFYGGTLENDGSISATGGSGGSSIAGFPGGKGGDGCVTSEQYNF
jgi:hypothetical protein